MCKSTSIKNSYDEIILIWMINMSFILKPGTLTLTDITYLLNENTTLELASDAHEKIIASEKLVSKAVAENKTIYGINTGFGALAAKKIDLADLESLQRSI